MDKINFRYSFSDEYITSVYADILELERKKDSTYNLKSEITLLTALIQKIVSTDNEEKLQYSESLRELIKLKAALIKEERQQSERAYREELAKARLKLIPFEEFKNGMLSILSIIGKYVSTETLGTILSEVRELTNDLEKRTKTI
jgi:hypothetical protein